MSKYHLHHPRTVTELKISDFILPFQRSGWYTAGFCRVRIYVSPADDVVAVLTNLEGSHHSVPNSVEWIRETLVTQGFIDSDAVILEHFEGGRFGEPFTMVFFDEAGEPYWRELSTDEATEFIGCAAGEFDPTTKENPRLSGEIERIRNAIDPFYDSPDLDDPAVYARKADIRRNMVTRKELKALVQSGATERTIQNLLRRDLSIFAEVYAGYTRDEYICFSEFPVADGFVDYVLFSGQSRMDITLIEIKGADFSLVKRGSYKGFAAKVHEAADQIARRLGDVYKHYDAFRREMHQIRQRVESGEKLYGAFLGPRSRLGVDPEKDVLLRSVVIGGRTRNDVDESKIRHHHEVRISPPIRIESWDTWLNKLQRS